MYPRDSSILDKAFASHDTPIKVTPAPLQGLTKRQYEVMDLVLAGHPSKNIAADLGISQRTVENHRAAIMQRTGATSLPALARLAIGADVVGDCVTRILIGHPKGF
jgi:FixJ family two-component response regulator